MSSPRVTCCHPHRDSETVWRHDHGCRVAPSARISVSQAASIQHMRRVGAQKAETARAGVVTVLRMSDAGHWMERRTSLPTDCDWHTGVEYTTGGVCAGPRCAAYLAAHVDDNDDRGAR